MEYFNGIVSSFNRATNCGIVRINGIEYEFPSTSFQAIKKPRFPRIGDEVVVIVKNDIIVGMIAYENTK